MKKTLFSIILIIKCLVAFGQDHSISKPLNLQHTVALSVGLEPFLYGLQYDLRFRTPNKWTDWAFGLQYLYGEESLETLLSPQNNPRSGYKHQQIENSAYCSFLLGRKNLTFETGLQMTAANITEYYVKTVSFGTYTINFISEKRDYTGVGLKIPLGLRYQPAHAGFFASTFVDFVFGGVRLSSGNFFENASFGPPEPYNVHLTLGYTFPINRSY